MKAPTRLASKVAARRGLPINRMMERTRSASILSMASAAASSHSTRLATVLSRCFRNAACACSTAASITFASDSMISEAMLSSIGQTRAENGASNFVAPPIQGMSCGTVMMLPLMHVLAFAERNIAQRARREQLLEFYPPVRETMLVRVLQKRLDGGPVRLDAIRIPVGAENRFLLLDERLQPRRRNFRRAHVREELIRMLLGAAKRLVDAERDPRITLVDIAPDHHRVHDGIDLCAAVIILLYLRVIREQSPDSGRTAAERK